MTVIVDTPNLTLTVPDIPLMVPARARAVVDQIQREYLELGLLALAGHVSEAAPRNFGHLAQSFGANPATSEGGVEILGATVQGQLTGRVFSSLPSALVMDQGRSPGKPISRAGVANIGLWVRRKLGLSGKDAQRATYAIAWAIRRRGIAGRFYAAKGMERAAPELDRLFTAMTAAIAAGLTTEGR